MPLNASSVLSMLHSEDYYLGAVLCLRVGRLARLLPSTSFPAHVGLSVRVRPRRGADHSRSERAETALED